MSLGTVEIPGGESLQIVEATNWRGCVDPREVEGIWTPSGTARLHLLVPGEIRSPGASFGDMMALKGAVPELENGAVLILLWLRIETLVAWRSCILIHMVIAMKTIFHFRLLTV